MLFIKYLQIFNRYIYSQVEESSYCLYMIHDYFLRSVQPNFSFPFIPSNVSSQRPQQYPLSQKGPSMSDPVLFCTCGPRLRQEDLGDTAGLVSDLCDEVNVTKSRPDDCFGFPRPITLDLRYSVVL